MVITTLQSIGLNHLYLPVWTGILVCKRYVENVRKSNLHKSAQMQYAHGNILLTLTYEPLITCQSIS